MSKLVTISWIACKVYLLWQKNILDTYFFIWQIKPYDCKIRTSSAIEKIFCEIVLYSTCKVYTNDLKSVTLLKLDFCNLINATFIQKSWSKYYIINKNDEKSVYFLELNITRLITNEYTL